ncbi:MAG: hypothetical protein ACOYBM_07190 [Dethiobacteria bacterium]|jgi:hypothetical protein
MNSNFRWQVAAVSLVISLLVIFLLFFWREQQLIQEPLFKYFKEQEEVKNIELEKINNKIVITADLRWVDNLPERLHNYEKNVSEIIGTDDFEIKLCDQRNPQLIDIYNSLHLFLYEGQRRGNYAEMKSNIEREILKHNVDQYRLYVDHKRIYIQLLKGGHYLYQIINIPEGEEVLITNAS